MAKKRLSKSSLLWFVRSRSYVSVADVRRRFGIDGGDDASAVKGPGGLVYVGLPPNYARFLEDLWREGKIGLELASDIRAKSVTGVYAVYQRGERPPAIAPEPLHPDADTAEGEPTTAW